MSQTYNIGCTTCKETLWIGQRTYIYTTQPDLDALRAFLYKHRSTEVNEPEHIIIFTESHIQDEEDWTEIERG